MNVDALFPPVDSGHNSVARLEETGTHQGLVGGGGQVFIRGGGVG